MFPEFIRTKRDINKQKYLLLIIYREVCVRPLIDGYANWLNECMQQ